MLLQPGNAAELIALSPFSEGVHTSYTFPLILVACKDYLKRLIHVTEYI
jgi:hypothetical protein